MQNKILIVVMGVTGCGKSSLAQSIANTLKVSMLEADDFHDAHSVSLMSKGIGLTEHERIPWLNRVMDACQLAFTRSDALVLSCSALKKAHRERLRAQTKQVYFLWLHTPEDVIRQRLMSRKGHFASATLLASQFEALEVPVGEKWVKALDGQQTLAATTDQSIAWLISLKSDQNPTSTKK